MAGGSGAAEGGGPMTLNERLRKALAPVGLPVLPDVDTRHRERCVTFNYELLPCQFADGRPLYDRALIQVHLFLPLKENGLRLRGRVRAALAGAGFAWPEVVDATGAEGQHYVFETEIILKLEE